MKNCTLILTALAWGFTTSIALADTQALNLPSGFSIEPLAFEVPNARQMALTANGTLIIGTQRAGVVYAVPNALGKAEVGQPHNVITLMKNLTMPSGVALLNGDLYVGATHQILRIAQIERHLTPSPVIETITNTLPDKRHHGWKYLKFGPDEKLYVPVGAPCNVCLSDDERFATILRMDPDSGQTEIWARGVRNTVGFAWHPTQQTLWFTDNGRDMLGDDIPAEELNVLHEPGKHFGFPFVHATGIDDPEFGTHKLRKDLTFVAPALNIQAHSAALGMTFYTASNNAPNAFPPRYHNAVFIAEHGSWNRSSKVGYQVSVVTEKDGVLDYAPFITGWLVNEDAWGRPNDVLVTPDGSLLISDDKQGLIYRVRYQAPLPGIYEG
ncbi:MAG: sorbosone dehydrogenase family protein [Gammaproteobacteria bacterium]|nr:sorbosone dehydrogenase family protein [Gammaproteobacteria bacterium]